MESRRHAQDGRRVQPAAQVAAYRHIGAQTHPHGIVERVAQPFDERRGIIACRRFFGGRIIKVPVSPQTHSGTAGDEEMPGRDLANAVEQGAVLRHQSAFQMPEGLAVPGGGNPGGEQGLDLGRQTQRAAIVMVVQRLDAEAVARREQQLVALVPQREGEFPAQLMQAVGPELVIQVQGDFAVGTGLQPITALAQLVLYAFKVVKLAVDDDPQRAVLIADRLRAAFRIDNTEPGVPQRHPAIRREPGPLPVRAAMLQAVHARLQRRFRNRSVRGIQSHYAAHNPSPPLRVSCYFTATGALRDGTS